MESANSQTIRSASINVNLEIKIKEFRTASRPSTKGTYIEHPDGNFNAWFSVSASPNGFVEDTGGWLVVRPYVTVLRGKYRPQHSVLSLIVSIIDIEGNSRFPRSFTQDLSKDVTNAKYFERSFFLDKADDFLPDDVLTLRCDISFQWYNAAPPLAPENRRMMVERIVPDAPRHDRKLAKKDSETGDPPLAPDNHGMMAERIVPDAPRHERNLATNDSETGYPIDDFADFVTKNKILSEVLYLAELGKVSAIYDPPSVKGRHPKAWAFGTRTECFNLILDEERDNIGTRFLKASPVIRRCVDAPMRERREKRIELPNVDGRTFKNVVYFLTKETLPKLELDELMEIYAFSHLYEMELLQRNCAEDIVNCLEREDDFKELLKVADFYSDEYLLGILAIRRHGDENVENNLPRLRMDDRPYSDCYI